MASSFGFGTRPGGKKKKSSKASRISSRSTSLPSPCPLSLSQELSFGALMTEKWFQFVVGEARTIVTVHKTPFTNMSEALEKMMSAGMREQDLGVAELPNVELDVFAAVYEFALRAEYWTPPIKEELPKDDNPEEDIPEEDIPQAEPEAINVGDQSTDEDGDESCEFEKLERTRFSRLVKRECTSLADNDQTEDEWTLGNEAWGETSKLRSVQFVTTETRESLTNINPLFHAKVYCFAEEKLCRSLKARSLYNIQQDLLELPLGTDSIDVILDLSEFVYLHTARSSSDGKDPLRRLLVRYITSKSATFCASQAFLDMLDSHAEMGADLFRTISKKG